MIIYYMQSVLQYGQTYFYKIASQQAVVLEEVQQEFRCGSACAEPMPKHFPLSYSVEVAQVGCARLVYISFFFVHIDILLFVVGFLMDHRV